MKYLRKYYVFKGKYIVQTLTKVNDKRMPALIGGFGKIKIQMQNSTTLESTSSLCCFASITSSASNTINAINATKEDKNNLEYLRNKFGPYLTGLIEADGSFAVHDKNSTAKRYLPKILIVFSLNDIPLAEKLISITGVGKLYIKKKQGCII